MITESKKRRIAVLVISLLCLIAIAACLISNIVISKRVTWALYPICAVPFAWAIISVPLLVKKQQVLCGLFSVSALLVPFLYVLERITPVRGWFSVLGLPVAVTVIIAVWMTYGIVRFLRARLNIWYLSAMIIFLYGIIVNTVVKYFACSFLHTNMLSVDFMINILSCSVITALLVFIGYNRNQFEKIKSENEDK